MNIFRSSFTGSVHHRFSGVLRCVISLFAVVFTTGLSGCSNETEVHPKQEAVSVDVPLSYAKGFSLYDHEGFKTLRVIVDLDGRQDTLRYLLIPKESPLPDGFDEHVVIRTPVERVALFSTTQVGYIDLLGCADRIIGIARPDYVNTPSLRERIEKGAVSEIGMPFSPNVEEILELNPEMIVTTALPAARQTDYKALVMAGIPVVVVAEWLEESPLGRAEWLKLYAALLGREEVAVEKFADIEHSYHALKALTDTLSHRPSVVTGMPFKDAWFVPGGNSYVACFLRDAGADYHWKNRAKTGSIKMDIEAVYPVALEAEFWLNPGTVQSLDELLAKDIRFRDFFAVRSGKVYNNNRLLNPAGGNAYWELGAVRPDRVLEDLIRILHPDLFPERGNGDDSLTFYRHIQ